MEQDKKQVCCAVCGEETAGNPTYSFYGSAHKWGPKSHVFAPKVNAKWQKEGSWHPDSDYGPKYFLGRDYPYIAGYINRRAKTWELRFGDTLIAMGNLKDLKAQAESMALQIALSKVRQNGELD